MMAIHATLDPVELLRSIARPNRNWLKSPMSVADQATPPGAPTMEQFLAGLRTAWREGEVRPTSKTKAKAPRGRRRPDPFVAVSALMRERFEAEPWRTSRGVRAAAN